MSRRNGLKLALARGLRSKTIIAMSAAVLSSGTLAAVSLAGVWSQAVQADFTNVHVRVVHTIANDYDSGWHYHPGLAIVQVQEGSFQITQGSCTPKTVSAGETYIETPYVPVRAVAKGKIDWTTTLIVRYEDPPLIPLTTNPCP
jgi:hypothetical protein